MLRLLQTLLFTLFLASSFVYPKVAGIHIKIPITITDSDSTHVNPVTLYFGVDPRATDCVDSSIGEYMSALQCGSPNQNCAQFQDPVGRFSFCIEFPSFTDLRKYKNIYQVDVYKITFSGKYPITIRWPVDLGSYYDSARIYDDICGCIINYNMLNRTSVVISSTTINTFYIRTVGPVVSTSVNPKGEEFPLQYSLSQNFPNPFNPSTTIHYELPSESYVTLKIFDMLGREIETLIHGKQSAGEHDVSWKANSLPSGVYYYRLTTPVYSVSKKMLFIR